MSSVIFEISAFASSLYVAIHPATSASAIFGPIPSTFVRSSGFELFVISCSFFGASSFTSSLGTSTAFFAGNSITGRAFCLLSSFKSDFTSLSLAALPVRSRINLIDFLLTLNWRSISIFSIVEE